MHSRKEHQEHAQFNTTGQQQVSCIAPYATRCGATSFSRAVCLGQGSGCPAASLALEMPQNQPFLQTNSLTAVGNALTDREYSARRSGSDASPAVSSMPSFAAPAAASSSTSASTSWRCSRSTPPTFTLCRAPTSIYALHGHGLRVSPRPGASGAASRATPSGAPDPDQFLQHALAELPAVRHGAAYTVAGHPLRKLGSVRPVCLCQPTVLGRVAALGYCKVHQHLWPSSLSPQHSSWRVTHNRLNREALQAARAQSWAGSNRVTAEGCLPECCLPGCARPRKAAACRSG